MTVPQSRERKRSKKGRDTDCAPFSWQGYERSQVMNWTDVPWGLTAARMLDLRGLKNIRLASGAVWIWLAARKWWP
jgi:hypothetical protein